MTLSLIVPSLDGSLPAGLPSDPDIELIIVKGVSPVGRARNLGLRRSHGDYVAWADADDELAPGWWPTVRAALTQPVDAVFLDYVRVSTAGERPWIWSPTGRGPLADMLSSRLSPEVWRTVVRRELWQGLDFDESLPVAEDYRLLPEVVARIRTWTRVGVLYRYRVRADSLMHAPSSERTRHCLDAARDRAERWRGTEWDDDAFAGAMRMAGWIDDTGSLRGETLPYIRRRWWRAMRSPRLSPWWKFKLTLQALRLGGILRPLYRLLAA